LFDQLRIPYATCEGELLLLGEAAGEYGRVFQTLPLAVLPEGRLPENDPPARQIAASMVEAVFPLPREPHELCCLTVPGDGSFESAEVQFFTRLVRLQGFTPLVLPAGLAVVLAELGRDGFTGIGISLGAASCRISIAHRGLELASASVLRGGDWIDAEVARGEGLYVWDPRGTKHLDTSSAAAWKETCGESLIAPTSDRGRRLADAYRQLLHDALTELSLACRRRPLVAELPQPLPVAVAGGAALATGFGELLTEAFAAVDLPFDTQPPRIAAGEYTVARGCLIGGELEADCDPGLRSAA
ncbi:MAG: hypothetical protein KY476_25145, partial [Planctomycetes bacterium]|nr:hypothetical protein [Planctomycetota bacterium]